MSFHSGYRTFSFLNWFFQPIATEHICLVEKSISRKVFENLCSGVVVSLKNMDQNCRKCLQGKGSQNLR